MDISVGIQWTQAACERSRSVPKTVASLPTVCSQGLVGSFALTIEARTPMSKEGEVWGAQIGAFVPQTQIKAELSSPVLLTGTRLSFKSRWRNIISKTIFKFTQFYKLTWKSETKPLTENLVVALPFFFVHSAMLTLMVSFNSCLQLCLTFFGIYNAQTLNFMEQQKTSE